MIGGGHGGDKVKLANLPLSAPLTSAPDPDPGDLIVSTLVPNSLALVKLISWCEDSNNADGAVDRVDAEVAVDIEEKDSSRCLSSSWLFSSSCSSGGHVSSSIFSLSASSSIFSLISSIFRTLLTVLLLSFPRLLPRLFPLLTGRTNPSTSPSPFRP